MSIIGSNILAGASGQAGGAGAYEIERSVRFSSSDSAYLSRTPAVAGDRRTWTWAGWVKLSSVTTAPSLFMCRNGGGDSGVSDFIVNSDGTVVFTGAANTFFTTTQVLRDFSAWYHLVLSVDTTAATAGNRIRFYLNGSQVTTFNNSYNPTQNFELAINQAAEHDIGGKPAVGEFFNGYLADIHFIDGQALDPSSFGEFDTNGVWQPIDASGLTFGTNGVHLPFSDNSTAAALGTDTSGNSNTWTVNNLSVAAGAGNDSLVDSPTSYGTDTGAGGEVVGNYATWNPLDNNTKSTGGNGNLEAVITGADALYGNIRATHGIGEKTYWETIVAGTSRIYQYHGIAPSDSSLVASGSGGVGYSTVANSVGVYCQDGTVYVNGSSVLTQSLGITTNDVLMHAYDPVSGKYWAGRNGTWFNSGNPAAGTGQVTTLSTSKQWMPAVSSASTQNITVNFGQRPFAYTAPSGFKALCTANLPEGTITTSGTFTGNALADGPFVYLNGVPTAMTINGNAVTFATHADNLSNGFKVRTSSGSYNTAGSNTYSISTTGAKFKYARAQANP